MESYIAVACDFKAHKTKEKEQKRKTKKMSVDFFFQSPSVHFLVIFRMVMDWASSMSLSELEGEISFVYVFDIQCGWMEINEMMNDKWFSIKKRVLWEILRLYFKLKWKN